MNLNISPIRPNESIDTSGADSKRSTGKLNKLLSVTSSSVESDDSAEEYKVLKPKPTYLELVKARMQADANFMQAKISQTQ